MCLYECIDTTLFLYLYETCNNITLYDNYMKKLNTCLLTMLIKLAFEGASLVLNINTQERERERGREREGERERERERTQHKYAFSTRVFLLEA